MLSRQVVNVNKSTIRFGACVESQVRKQIICRLKMEMSTGRVKYLGVFIEGVRVPMATQRE